MNATQNWRVSMGPDGVKTEPVYVCRCGQTHEGDYAIYEYGHHMCFHEEPLLDVGLGQVACALCGLYWRVEKTDWSDPEKRWPAKPLTRWQQILSYLRALYR